MLVSETGIPVAPFLATDDHERDTRFQGLKQECGLHLDSMKEWKSLDSSYL